MNIILTGLTLGLTAGLKPGPLGIFVIHQTMTKGSKDGFIASLAPWISDGPIILLSLFLTVALKDLTWFVSLISLAGSLYLISIAVKILKAPHSINPSKGGGSSSLLGAVKVNLLNPSPYIFWLTIGGGIISKGTLLEGVLFIAAALGTLSMTKFTVAVLMQRLGKRFNPKIYSLVLRALSLPLFLFSGQLLYSSIVIWFKGTI